MADVRDEDLGFLFGGRRCGLWSITDLGHGVLSCAREVPAPVRGDAEAVRLWAEVLTGRELDEHGAVRVLDVPTWQERRQRLEQWGGPPLP